MFPEFASMRRTNSQRTEIAGVKAPFAWYGGKAYYARWLIARFPNHVTYVEPFGGAGHVLCAKSPSVIEVYNDLDDRVVNFYRVVRDPESFERLRLIIELSPHARREFTDDMDTSVCEDPVENARRFFVVMKQARGGLGMSKVTTRSWAVSKRVRNVMPEVVSKFLSTLDGLAEVHERLRHVTIECESAVRVIRSYDSEDTFFYLDPSYLPETRHGRKASTYAHEMTRDDHEALLDLILTVKGKVMISGYASDLYDSKLAGWRREELVATAHVANSGQRRVEVIWMNY